MSIKKDAEELCLKVDDPWSDDMIEKAIDEKLNGAAEKPKKTYTEEGCTEEANESGQSYPKYFRGSLQGVRQNCSAWGRVHPDRCRPKRRKRAASGSITQ